MEILAATAGIFGIRGDKCQMDKAEIQAYREAFSNFDWNHNGKISYGSLLPAMRRAGVNPTEVNWIHLKQGNFKQERKGTFSERGVTYRMYICY